MKRVLVVGGSPEYAGAVYLAAIAALRAGAESVVVAAPAKVGWAVNVLSPDLMTRKLPGEYLSKAHGRDIRKLLKTADILLLGNGAGMREDTQALMRSLMRWKGQKVIDADALKALREPVTGAILTPNTREWDLLAARPALMEKLMAENVIVRKGTTTELVAGERRYRQKRTNPGLEKAGTGDVLAGMCAGFLAQGISPWDAAKKAMETGNTIADVLAKRKKGYYFLASDIADELKNFLKIGAE